jgi:hypothetical protein
MSPTPPADDRTDDDLYHEVMSADWNIGTTAVSSDGVTLTFRKHYTSDCAGVETRKVFGKDRADAMRKFLVELESERGEGS